MQTKLPVGCLEIQLSLAPHTLPSAPLAPPAPPLHEVRRDVTERLGDGGAEELAVLCVCAHDP